mmetsp:Transcript_76351/g.182804  ORF Transcript_76351/g.182804 Transcript_76351/m.182804 type:complete len:395 (-) Transcript_76351:295-1479(-)
MSALGEDGALLVARSHEHLLVVEAGTFACGAVGALLGLLIVTRHGIAEAKSRVHPAVLQGSLLPTGGASGHCAAAPGRASAGMGACCQGGALGVAEPSMKLLVRGARVLVILRDLRCKRRLLRIVCGGRGRRWHGCSRHDGRGGHSRGGGRSRDGGCSRDGRHSGCRRNLEWCDRRGGLEGRHRWRRGLRHSRRRDRWRRRLPAAEEAAPIRALLPIRATTESTHCLVGRRLDVCAEVLNGLGALGSGVLGLIHVVAADELLHHRLSCRNRVFLRLGHLVLRILHRGSGLRLCALHGGLGLGLGTLHGRSRLVRPGLESGARLILRLLRGSLGLAHGLLHGFLDFARCLLPLDSSLGCCLVDRFRLVDLFGSRLFLLILLHGIGGEHGRPNVVF